MPTCSPLWTLACALVLNSYMDWCQAALSKHCTNEPTSKQGVCGRQLSMAIQMICQSSLGNRAPGIKSYSRQAGKKQGVLPSYRITKEEALTVFRGTGGRAARYKRAAPSQGIVCECCTHRCSYLEMKEYCKRGGGYNGPQVFLQSNRDRTESSTTDPTEEHTDDGTENHTNDHTGSNNGDHTSSPTSETKYSTQDYLHYRKDESSNSEPSEHQNKTLSSHHNTSSSQSKHSSVEVSPSKHMINSADDRKDALLVHPNLSVEEGVERTATAIGEEVMDSEEESGVLNTDSESSTESYRVSNEPNQHGDLVNRVSFTTVESTVDVSTIVSMSEDNTQDIGHSIISGSMREVNQDQSAVNRERGQSKQLINADDAKLANPAHVNAQDAAQEAHVLLSSDRDSMFRDQADSTGHDSVHHQHTESVDQAERDIKHQTEKESPETTDYKEDTSKKDSHKIISPWTHKEEEISVRGKHSEGTQRGQDSEGTYKDRRNIEYQDTQTMTKRDDLEGQGHKQDHKHGDPKGQGHKHKHRHHGKHQKRSYKSESESATTSSIINSNSETNYKNDLKKTRNYNNGPTSSIESLTKEPISSGTDMLTSSGTYSDIPMSSGTDMQTSSDFIESTTLSHDSRSTSDANFGDDIGDVVLQALAQIKMRRSRKMRLHDPRHHRFRKMMEELQKLQNQRILERDTKYRPN